MNKTISKKRETFILSGIFFLGSLLYISLIFNQNLWMDEAFSATLLRNNFSGVIEASAKDTLPPLYNILNKCMTLILGYHPWVMKLSSVIPMILTMLLCTVYVKKRFGFCTSLLSIICLSGMPYLLYYGVEIRMYSLGLFFVTASGIFAYEVYCDNQKRDWLFFLFFSVCAGYTHHFAFVSVGFVYLFLLIAFIIKDHKKIKFWILNLVATFILYFPCLLTTLKQMQKVSGYFTMPDITFSFVLQCLRNPFVTEWTPLSVLLLLVYLSMPIYLLFSTKNPLALFPGICGTLVFLGTLGFGSFATILLKSNIFTDRYLIPSYGLFWLSFAIWTGAGYNYLKPQIRIWASSCLIILLCLVITKTYVKQFQLEYADGVNQMTDYFQKNIKAGDEYLIYENDYQIEICFRYYFPSFKKCDWDTISDSGQLWYLEVPGFESQMDSIKLHGYHATDAGEFSFDRYSFHLYHLEKNNESADNIIVNRKEGFPWIFPLYL